MPARPIGARAPSFWLATPRAHKGGLPDSHGRTQEWVDLLAHGQGRRGRTDLAHLSYWLGLPGRNLLAAIYEHMNGFPPGWLSNAVRPTETPSSRNSPKP